MNYEIKSVSPGSIFVNAIRIFLVIGFIVGINYFFIVRNGNFQIASWWQKILATLLFTVVYALVVSVVLTLIGWLYNVWAAKFKGVNVRLEQQP